MGVVVRGRHELLLPVVKRVPVDRRDVVGNHQAVDVLLSSSVFALR